MLAKWDVARERRAEPPAIRLPVRDPEDRRVAEGDTAAVREKMLDKTLADSYPASDPPSTIPDPADPTTTGADAVTPAGGPKQMRNSEFGVRNT